MRISDRYIGKQVLYGTLFAVVVLSLVLVLGNLFKEIRPLLVDKQAPPWLVLQFVFNVLLMSLMFSIPWGFLSAVLLVFGRLSVGQEITGFRIAGISLPRLVAPVFVVAALCSGCCLWLNVNVVPRAKAPVRELVYEQVKRDPRALLSPGIASADFENVKFYIEDQVGDSMVGMHLYRIRANAPSMEPPSVRLDAGRFTFVVDDVNKELRLKLYNARFQTIKKKNKPAASESVAATPDTDAPPQPTTQEEGFEIFSAAEAEPYLLPFGELFQKKHKPSAMTNGEIRTHLAANPDLPDLLRVRFEAEVQQRYSFSMACLAFAFVAVPLGMQSRRRESSSGLLLSLLLGGAYFLFSILADEAGSGLQAALVLWAPNLLCVVIGLWLFKRAKYK